ncbi:MAG: M48 family metalloprotease [Desulfobacterales bacterium]|nr:M48 family metalloprotease [Desulfobacterales bacterium]
MQNDFEPSVFASQMTRRHFLCLASSATAGLVIGCATNPVTGENQLMLVSENREIELDKQNSPHQFSADYGITQDARLNTYVESVGKGMASCSHRAHMPYSFRAVNATYVNAYAFPGGSIAVTRGILVSLKNEAGLAGLLGHEIGHVNARHTAERMSKGMLVSTILTGVAVCVGMEDESLGQVAAGLGAVGAGILLAKYSRDDEREADNLGMVYMSRAGHNPYGMVGLMDLLRDISKHEPNVIEMMFSTHPMSEERYQTALTSAQTKYKAIKNKEMRQERYMDNIAGLREIKDVIVAMQHGEKEMARKKFPRAETHFLKALKQAPNDYAALVMMSKCQLAQNKHEKARQYAEQAKQVYPQEAQAHHMAGAAKLKQDLFDAAYEDFCTYEKLMPGNPNTIFFKGLALEKMQRQEASATEYQRYLKIVKSGPQAQHAYQRLVEWGYIKNKG